VLAIETEVTGWSERQNTMKSTFTLNAAIGAMLDLANYDRTKIVNAVQSALNDASLIGEEAKRGNVKLVAKGKEFSFSEANRLDYLGKTTMPAQFASWHDAVAVVFKKHGDPHDVLPAAILPASLKFWLDAKFILPVNPANAAKTAPTTPATKSNGKRNGNIESVAPVGQPS